jgi:hypothetical protein
MRVIEVVTRDGVQLTPDDIDDMIREKNRVVRENYGLRAEVARLMAELSRRGGGGGDGSVEPVADRDVLRG